MVRGRNDAPLSIRDLRQGLYELAHRLEPYAHEYRAKRATLYLTIVDGNGAEVQDQQDRRTDDLPTRAPPTGWDKWR
jgi:hypothetical protein